MATPTLKLGSFNLSDITGGTYGTSVTAQGTSKGSPVPIDQAVNTWLQDGSIVIAQGYDNRNVTVRVKLRAPTTTALAVAEAALHMELRKPNLLTWTPSSGPASVFEVINSSMDPVEDETSDLAESKAYYPWRHYDIRLTCAATVCSLTETVTAALPASGTTTTLLDACSATTGWAGTNNGASVSPSTSGGSVILTQAAAFGDYTLALTKTFAATTSSTKYLVVDWQPSVFSGGTSSDLKVTGDGVVLPVLASGPSPTSGYVRTWFYVAASSLAVTTLSWFSSVSVYSMVNAPARVLKIDNVAVTDVKPSLGTGRQQIRSVDVAGSARTPGSLAIESTGTAGLGDTFVYTYPANDSTKGYVPSLRQYRTAGNTVTTDSAMISGARESVASGGTTYTIPLGLFPRGSYHFYVRLATPTPGNAFITYTFQTTLGSNQLGTTTTNSQVYALTSTYQTILVSKLSLPTIDLDPLTPASLSININSPYGGVVNIDEAWLYNVSIGRLIRVNCGTGTAAVGGPARRLFIEPATVATPRPTVRMGHSADRSDAYYPIGSLMRGWQFPEFASGRTFVFFVTPDVTDASATFRAFNRWHTNPAS